MLFLAFWFCEVIGVFCQIFSGLVSHHFKGGMVAWPGALCEGTLAHFWDFFCDFVKIAAIDMQRVAYIDVSSCGDGLICFFGDFLSDYFLEFGEGVDVHKPGFVKVSASPVCIHIKRETAFIVVDESAP